MRRTVRSSLVPRLSLRHSGVQRSYVKIVRGEGEPGDEATFAPGKSRIGFHSHRECMEKLMNMLMSWGNKVGKIRENTKILYNVGH